MVNYRIHPSKRLVEHFAKFPWQGADPFKAKFIFVGLDANFDENIEFILPEIWGYLNNGVQFWQENSEGVHHPFLLSKYQGKGKKYHKKFAEIGFKTKHAEFISFVEIFSTPTVGISRLNIEDLDCDHLGFIEKIIECSNVQYIFVCPKVFSLMKKMSSIFPWVNRKVNTDGNLSVINLTERKKIIRMYHFSCYGWQLQNLNRQILQLRNLIF